MCKQANKTVAALMAGIEPTVKELLTFAGVANTPEAQAAITAFDTAQQAVANWVPGTTSAEVVEVLEAFDQVFDTLPVPEEAKALGNIILAGITTVIGIISANSPAPVPAGTPTVADANAEVAQATHAAHVAHDTEAKVTTLVPGFERAVFTAPDKQYKNAWNKEVDKLGDKYASLKQ